MSEDYNPGQRFQVDKQKATLRFVGEIEGQAGTWVGLEWDDSARGRHDGSHLGKRCTFLGSCQEFTSHCQCYNC